MVEGSAQGTCIGQYIPMQETSSLFPQRQQEIHT